MFYFNERYFVWNFITFPSAISSYEEPGDSCGIIGFGSCPLPVPSLFHHSVVNLEVLVNNYDVIVLLLTDSCGLIMSMESLTLHNHSFSLGIGATPSYAPLVIMKAAELGAERGTSKGHWRHNIIVRKGRFFRVQELYGI